MAFDSDWQAHRAHALDLILEASLRPEAWNDFLAHLCKTVGATSGAIAVRTSRCESGWRPGRAAGQA